MKDYIVKGIVSTLHENYNRKNIKGNELKNALNAVCECVSNESDIDNKVKKRIEIAVESYLNTNKQMLPENYVDILNVVAEGFGEKLQDFAHTMKGKMIGTPEEAAKTVDRITSAIVAKLHEIYPNAKRYANTQQNGFAKRLIEVCTMIPDESYIDSVIKNVVQNEVENILEVFPLVNYRNPKNCFNIVKDAIGGAGGLLYGTTDFISAVKNALGKNENTYEMNESELIEMIKGSVRNHLKEMHIPKGGYAEYEGNDMSYDSVYDRAEQLLYSGNEYSDVEELMNDICQVDTLNGEDYEIVYDACEDALLDYYNDNGQI